MSNKVSEMTLNQWSEVAVALGKAGFTDSFLKTVINSPGNLLAQKMYKDVKPFVECASDFDWIGEIILDVPKYYDHDTQIEAFYQGQWEQFSEEERMNPPILDTNFSKATVRLKPGDRKIVRVYKIKRRDISKSECLDYITAQGGLPAGVQATTFIWEEKLHLSPKGKAVLCFDFEEALWKDPNEHNSARVPFFIAKDSIPAELVSGMAFSYNPFDVGDIFFGIFDLDS